MGIAAVLASVAAVASVASAAGLRFALRRRGFLLAAVLVLAAMGAMVVDEFVFCADTTGPALDSAVITTTASPRTKR
jgi:hypothetical protein